MRINKLIYRCKLHRSNCLIPIGIISVLVYLSLFGCGLRPREAPPEDPRTKGEKQFDPLGFPQDQAIVTEGESGQKKEKISASEREKKNRLKESEKEKTTLPRRVYRVQFYATQYPDEASRVAELVKNQLSENTYIDYKVPYYWVRAGDCETKDEAESLLEKIRALGYKESWMVEGKIEQ